MTAPTAINPKGRLLTRGATAAGWLDDYLTSTVGQKIVIALTGVGLVLFTVFHMVGNLKMFPGGEASREGMNAYAYFLKHDLGAWLWAARAGLLAIFLLHLYVALRLKGKAAAARPVGYAYHRYAQATPASTTMVWTGVVVGAFVVFHIAHYTLGWVHDRDLPSGGHVPYLQMTEKLPDGAERQDVYNMVIAGFTTWWISVIYLIAQTLLFVHLSHGIPSAFQTLGVKSRRFAAGIKWLGLAVAGVIFVGNCLIVFAVWGGYVTYVE